MNNYQRRKGIMLCHPLEQKRLDKWGIKEAFFQPKLDGIRCLAKWNPQEGTYSLYTSEGNLLDLPHISQAIEENLDIEVFGDFTLDGEIYVHGWPFERILSTAKRHHHPAAHLLEYHVFDYKSSEPFMLRNVELHRLLKEGGPIELVKTVYQPMDVTTELLSIFTSRGYEGLIVRHPENIYEEKRSTTVLKFKPKKTDTYFIVGCKEEVSKDGDPKGTLGALELIDLEGNRFSVGSGLTKENRESLWKVRKRLPGKKATISYQSATKKGIPRFPVFVSIT